MSADGVLEHAGVFWCGSGSTVLCRAELEVGHFHELAELSAYIYLDVSLLLCHLQLIGYVGWGIGQQED